MARTTVSAGIANSEPGTGSGRRRPGSSGSPRRMRWHSAAETCPFSPAKRVGAVRYWNWTPSSRAWRRSPSPPFCSCSVRRGMRGGPSGPGRAAVGAHGGAHSVLGGRAPADDEDVPAERQGFAHLLRELVGLQVAAHQELRGLVDAGPLLAGAAPPGGGAGAGAG